MRSWRVIAVLLAAIALLSVILGVKIYNNSNSTENKIYNNSIVTNEIENSVITEETPIRIEQNTSQELITSIINIVVILVVVPYLLRKYELFTCVIFMTIFQIIRAFFMANLLSLGLWGILILALLFVVHYYLLFWVINKFLLEAGPLAYFFGVIIVEGIVSYITKFIMAIVLSSLLL